MVALEGLLQTNPLMMPRVLQTRLVDVACAILSQQNVQSFTLTHQALSTIEAILLGKHHGFTLVFVSAIVSTVVGVVETPPSFHGQACVHTVLSKARRLFCSRFVARGRN